MVSGSIPEHGEVVRQDGCDQKCENLLIVQKKGWDGCFRYTTPQFHPSMEEEVPQMHESLPWDTYNELKTPKE